MSCTLHTIFQLQFSQGINGIIAVYAIRYEILLNDARERKLKPAGLQFTN